MRRGFQWPLVSRAWHESELARAEAICRVQREVQDRNLQRERDLHDEARNDVRLLTSQLAAMTAPQPKSLPAPTPALPAEIVAQIRASARGDDALARLLYERARQMRAAAPQATGAQIAYAIKFNEAIPDETTAEREMAVVE